MGFWTRIFLFGTALTPLVIIPFTIFPFTFGKMIFLWVIGVLVLSLLVVYFFIKTKSEGWQIKGWKQFLNPIFITLLIFIVSAVLSTIFAPDAYRGFFGDIERGDGLYSLIVYLIIFTGMFFFFEEKHWKIYFRLGMGAGLLLALHVLIQYLGIDFLPIGRTRQPGSFLGNPAFVSSFFILLFGYAAIVYKNTNGFWKYFSIVFGLVGLEIIGLLEIRGALVGLAAGLLVFLVGLIFKHKTYRLTATIVLAVLVLMSAVLWFTRDSALWSSVPVLNRVSAFSLESGPVQTRLLALGVSWNAFKERPIFGWGPENYNIAYNKYYNSAYAVYTEEWFDRAHNKFLDVLVMQGIVGTISYVLLFVALFYVLKKAEELKRIRLLLSAIIVAYIVQNLFIFDHINSYLPFFAILSFCASRYYRSRLKVRDVNEVILVPKLGRVLLGAGVVVVVPFVIYSLYSWSFTPISQAKNYTNLLSNEPTTEKVLSNAEDFLEPYNFYQKEMRMQFMQIVLSNENLATDPPHPLFIRALEALEETALKEAEDPKVMIRISEAYNQLAKSNPKFFIESEEFIKAARELSPERQDIRGVHALILSSAGRHDEAIKLARETVDIEPRSSKSHYYLGMALALSLRGKEEGEEFTLIKEEALRELDYAQELRLRGEILLFTEGDFQNMMVVYQNLEEYDKLLEIFKVAKNFFSGNIYHYRAGLLAALKIRDETEVVVIAEEIKKLDPKQVDVMDVIIDLARRGKWEILEDL